jgi:hypothetical protein
MRRRGRRRCQRSLKVGGGSRRGLLAVRWHYLPNSCRAVRGKKHRIDVVAAVNEIDGAGCVTALRPEDHDARNPSVASCKAPLIYVSRTEISCICPQWGQFTFSIAFQDALRLCTSVSMPDGACRLVLGQMKISGAMCRCRRSCEYSPKTPSGVCLLADGAVIFFAKGKLVPVNPLPPRVRFKPFLTAPAFSLPQSTF